MDIDAEPDKPIPDDEAAATIGMIDVTLGMGGHEDDLGSCFHHLLPLLTPVPVAQPWACSVCAYVSVESLQL